MQRSEWAQDEPDCEALARINSLIHCGHVSELSAAFRLQASHFCRRPGFACCVFCRFRRVGEPFRTAPQGFIGRMVGSSISAFRTSASLCIRSGSRRSRQALNRSWRDMRERGSRKIQSPMEHLERLRSPNRIRSWTRESSEAASEFSRFRRHATSEFSRFGLRSKALLGVLKPGLQSRTRQSSLAPADHSPSGSSR
jgi:hypothetical protein